MLTATADSDVPDVVSSVGIQTQELIDKLTDESNSWSKKAFDGLRKSGKLKQDDIFDSIFTLIEASINADEPKHE